MLTSWTLPSAVVLLVSLSLEVSATRSVVSLSSSLNYYPQKLDLQVVVNQCKDTIWPAYSQNLGSQSKGSGGWEAAPGSSMTIGLPDSWLGYICKEMVHESIHSPDRAPGGRQACTNISTTRLTCLTGECTSLSVC